MTIVMSPAKARWATRVIAVSLVLAPTSVIAQIVDQQDTASQPLRPQTPTISPGGTGRVAESAVGVAGQRQARGQETANIQPMARIASRIQNRVQNRIHNRIDRSYDPQATATSPFAVAEDQARTSTRR